MSQAGAHAPPIKASLAKSTLDQLMVIYQEPNQMPANSSCPWLASCISYPPRTLIHAQPNWKHELRLGQCTRLIMLKKIAWWKLHDCWRLEWCSFAPRYTSLSSGMLSPMHQVHWLWHIPGSMGLVSTPVASPSWVVDNSYFPKATHAYHSCCRSLGSQIMI